MASKQTPHYSWSGEGDPSVFKANKRFEDIEALFAEASRVNLSVRDAIIYSIQELCAADPRDRAHRLDIFNAVFLKRMCSPNSVSVLLYTQPCFEQLGDSFFRYNPTPDARPVAVQPRTKPASRLWKELASDPVSPEPPPAATEVHLEVESPTPEVSIPVESQVAEPDVTVSPLPLEPEEREVTKITLEEERPTESLSTNPVEPEPLFTVQRGAREHDWEEELETLSGHQDELKAAEIPVAPVDGTLELSPEETLPAVSDISTEPDVKSDQIQQLQPEHLSQFPAITCNESDERSLSSDWEHEVLHDPVDVPAPEVLASSVSVAAPEPEPVRVNAPARVSDPLPETIRTRPIGYRKKIPARPLHKQPIHRRVLFYLRTWLHLIFRRTA